MSHIRARHRPPVMGKLSDPTAPPPLRYLLGMNVRGANAEALIFDDGSQLANVVGLRTVEDGEGSTLVYVAVKVPAFQIRQLDESPLPEPAPLPHPAQEARGDEAPASPLYSPSGGLGALVDPKGRPLDDR